MNAQEAYKLFRQAKSNLVVMSCHEYDSCFVFHAVPPEFSTPKKSAEVFDSLYAVDRKSSEISMFIPLNLPKDERKRGRRLPIYDKI